MSIRRASIGCLAFGLAEAAPHTHSESGYTGPQRRATTGSESVLAKRNLGHLPKNRPQRQHPEHAADEPVNQMIDHFAWHVKDLAKDFQNSNVLNNLNSVFNNVQKMVDQAVDSVTEQSGELVGAANPVTKPSDNPIQGAINSADQMFNGAAKALDTIIESANKENPKDMVNLGVNGLKSMLSGLGKGDSEELKRDKSEMNQYIDRLGDILGKDLDGKQSSDTTLEHLEELNKSILDNVVEKAGPEEKPFVTDLVNAAKDTLSMVKDMSFSTDGSLARPVVAAPERPATRVVWQPISNEEMSDFMKSIGISLGVDNRKNPEDFAYIAMEYAVISVAIITMLAVLIALCRKRRSGSKTAEPEGSEFIRLEEGQAARNDIIA